MSSFHSCWKPFYVCIYILGTIVIYACNYSAECYVNYLCVTTYSILCIPAADYAQAQGPKNFCGRCECLVSCCFSKDETAPCSTAQSYGSLSFPAVLLLARRWWFLPAFVYINTLDIYNYAVRRACICARQVFAFETIILVIDFFYQACYKYNLIDLYNGELYT